MSKKLKIFSERLREIRGTKKLSQTDLAERSGLQPAAISHFENNRRLPSFDNLKRLADALNVTIDYLLGRSEEPKNSGPIAEQLFRDFGQMSTKDQEMIVNFVKMLSAKGEKKENE